MSGAIVLTRLDSAPHILGMGHWFKMRWVDACRDAAKVVKFKTIGYRPNRLLIHRPVGIAMTTTYGDFSVTERVVSAVCPYPTRRVIPSVLNPVIGWGKNPWLGVMAVNESPSLATNNSGQPTASAGASIWLSIASGNRTSVVCVDKADVLPLHMPSPGIGLESYRCDLAASTFAIHEQMLPDNQQYAPRLG